MADTLLLTKTDLADAAALQALEQQLARTNASAPQHHVVHGQIDSAHLRDLEHQFLAHPWGGRAPSGAGRGWLLRGTERQDAPLSAVLHRMPPAHTPDITTECFALHEPLQAQVFQHWLELMAALRGDRMLRFKGLIHVADDPGRPLVVHAAQHLVHPPRRLPAWPGADRRSLLVFITQGMERGLIVRTLHKFTGALAIPSHT